MRIGAEAWRVGRFGLVDVLQDVESGVVRINVLDGRVGAIRREQIMIQHCF